MLLWDKNNTTGGEKGVPVEEETKVSQCCFEPKIKPQEEKKVSQCCFEPKTEPQEEKKVSQWRRRKRFPSAALSKNRTTEGEKGFPVLL